MSLQNLLHDLQMPLLGFPRDLHSISADDLVKVLLPLAQGYPRQDWLQHRVGLTLGRQEEGGSP